MIPPAFLDELRDRVSMSELVGRRVKLTKRGREHHGLCPVHNEKTPSFTVNDDKQFCHCFGCGFHADAIEFIQRVERRNFVDAVEELAAMAGLEVPTSTPEERAHAVRQATLLEAVEAACAYFEAQLHAPAGAQGLAYLRGRGLTDETIARFRLGWAPNGDAMRRALPRDQFPDDLLVEVGLLRRRESDGTLAAMFRARVTFPIMGRRGRVVGFGARTLGATSGPGGQPKYLNSPDTPLFAKGEMLFGLSHARDGVADAGMVAAVEGYLDVISMHQAGLRFAVAPLGTAITDGQLNEMWRCSPNAVMCFDGDQAGSRAARRAADRAVPLLKPGLRLSFASIGGGVVPAPDLRLRWRPGQPLAFGEGEAVRVKDPDEMIRRLGAGVMRRVLAEAVPLADMLWMDMTAAFPPDTPERFAALERALYGLAARIADPAVRRAYLGDFRRRLYGGDAEIETTPTVLVGTSKKKTAPQRADECLRREWRGLLAAAKAGPVREWLEERGIPWTGIGRALGGLGVVRARVVKGRWVNQWSAIEPTMLWEPHVEAGDPVKLLVIPEWEGRPGGRLLDLIGWDPKTDLLCSRTGHAVVAGEELVAEAMGIEAQGLPHPVALAASPLSWLRRTAAAAELMAAARKAGDPPPEADKPVLVVDWARAWDVLGGLRQVVAESEAHFEIVSKLLRPPRWRRPDIGYVVGVQ